MVAETYDNTGSGIRNALLRCLLLENFRGAFHPGKTEYPDLK